MLSPLKSLVLLILSVATVVRTQSLTSSASGYAGYSLGVTGDSDSTIYETEDTDTTNSSVTNPPPDVFLNATVNVGEIDIKVSNLSAKINLDAQVLSLLTFNAGVDVSIDRVELLIENVTAKVLLEARLANLVTMISDVLDSIDLNPVIATVSSGLGDVVSGAGSALNSTASTAASGLSARSFDVAKNILYSVNDYSGNTHTNRILEQDGTIVDQYLDNNGNVHGQKIIGSYSSDMSFNGDEIKSTVNGRQVQKREYIYAPFSGLNVVSFISFDASNEVVATQVLSESFAGGMSSLGN